MVRETLRTATVVTVSLTVAFVGSVATAWHYRERLIHWSASGFVRLLGPADQLLGATPPSRATLVQRGYRFTDAIGRLADAPGTLHSSC